MIIIGRIGTKGNRIETIELKRIQFITGDVEEASLGGKMLKPRRNY